MPKKEKPYNNGQWSEARFKGFIISALRGASQRWGPKAAVIKEARVRRGWYKCEGCKQEVPATKQVTLKNGKKKRVKNILADHIDPIIDPKVGFVDYNTWIERCFVEKDKYQALCHDCHTKKTEEEKQIAKTRRAK